MNTGISVSCAQIFWACDVAFMSDSGGREGEEKCHVIGREAVGLVPNYSNIGVQYQPCSSLDITTFFNHAGQHLAFCLHDALTLWNELSTVYPKTSFLLRAGHLNVSGCVECFSDKHVGKHQNCPLMWEKNKGMVVLGIVYTKHWSYQVDVIELTLREFEIVWTFFPEDFIAFTFD